MSASHEARATLHQDMSFACADYASAMVPLVLQGATASCNY